MVAPTIVQPILGVISACVPISRIDDRSVRIVDRDIVHANNTLLKQRSNKDEQQIHAVDEMQESMISESASSLEAFRNIYADLKTSNRRWSIRRWI